MESILSIKKGVATTLCFTLFVSNLFFVSEVFAQENDSVAIPEMDSLSSTGTGFQSTSWPSPSGTPSSTSIIPSTNQETGIQNSNSPLYDAWNNPQEVTPFESWDQVMEQYNNTQAGQARAGEGIKDSSQSGGSSPVTSTASCAIGTALGSAVSSAMQQAATKILAKIAVGKAMDTAKKVITVPVLDNSVVREAQTQNNKLGNIEAKETGLSLFGIPILPSWDAIGYCIINTMIAYISESTIRWINSGFKGNPAFIENFDQFFEDLANRQVAIFLGTIASTDFLCGDLKVGVQRNILDRYNNNYYNDYSRTGSTRGYGACTFDERFGSGNYSSGGSSVGGQNPISLAAYTNGDRTASVQGGWEALAMVARPENNTFGATIQANSELNRKIESVTESAKTEVIDVNKGNLSKKDARGNVVTPGSVIEGRLNKALDIPSDRLNIADEFNEVVTALVNQLIKVALDETLGRVNSGLREIQRETRDELRDLAN